MESRKFSRKKKVTPGGPHVDGLHVRHMDQDLKELLASGKVRDALTMHRDSDVVATITLIIGSDAAERAGAMLLKMQECRRELMAAKNLMHFQETMQRQVFN